MNDATLMQEDFAVRCQRVLSAARAMYSNNPDWLSFFREILGIMGKARQCFAAEGEFVQFERTPEFLEIQNMLNSLHGRRVPGSHAVQEPTRVITVRLPESVHEALKREATDHNTSMNKLCITKLLQVLNDEAEAAVERGGVAGANRMGAYTPSASAPPNFRSTYGAAQM